MCDTLCVVGRDRTLFAKNSDRPPSEAQVVESFPRRAPGGRLRTQYLEIDDTGAAAVLGSRPEWLWGLEHGVNEHRVAVGNERIWTVDDPDAAPPALIGMDLVRLGLERAGTADEALEVMTTLLEAHGQGGIADAEHGEAYFSSFLVADPTTAWVLETSGRTWAARPATQGAAISNRVSIGADWARASDDVPPDADWDAWRDPAAATDHADVRLAVTRACRPATPADLASTMRDHGDGSGLSVCMHIPGYMATTASMVADLPAHPAEPAKAWVALGHPCRSVYVPAPVPPAMAHPETWGRFAALSRRPLDEVRAVLDPIEAELWDGHPDPWPAVDDGLVRLGV